MSANSRLATLNSLVHTASGVWTVNDSTETFSYSDGVEAENSLEAVISKATDRSDHSSELERRITDWVSEYHLSPVHANILRYLNLQNNDTVLELGCGCGALTRYLGELNLSVDAVEGSSKRARLAKLRCQGLDNVHIVSRNFFDLELPINHYDVILFIGVMEYAGRFSPNGEPAGQAVKKLLQKITASLTSKGAIIIAIENRLGRKYFCGSGEDHYGIAFEGIHDYPHYSGIKTWSRGEWSAILQQTNLHHAFHYPFPDYKLPSLILNDLYLESNPNAWTHLTGLSYRDYHNLIPPKNDLRFWEHAHNARRLGSFANSFLIVASSNSNNLLNIAPYDFVHFSNISRRSQFRTQTRKHHAAAVVEKLSLQDCGATSVPSLIQDVGIEEWRGGITLSNIWIKHLHSNPRHESLQELATEYFSYLKSMFEKLENVSTCLDMVPMNIMVNASGDWNSFDHEWHYSSSILGPEFVLFRGLFYFIELAQQSLAKIYENTPHWTIEHVLSSCFSYIGLDLDSRIKDFATCEDGIQNSILTDRKGACTQDSLRLLIAHSRNPTQLFWANQKQDFSEARSQTKFISTVNWRQTITFEVPISVHFPIALRFDPGTDAGLFSIETMETVGISSKRSIAIQQLFFKKARDRKLVNFHNIQLSSRYLGLSFYSLNKDPNISWLLPSKRVPEDIEYFRIQITMKWLGVQRKNRGSNLNIIKKLKRSTLKSSVRLALKPFISYVNRL